MNDINKTLASNHLADMVEQINRTVELEKENQALREEIKRLNQELQNKER